MKALIHIGMPKTGSTTIQRFLQVNRASLRKDGILYRRYHLRASQPEFVVAVESSSGRLISNPRVRGSLRLTSLQRQRALSAMFERRLARDIASSGCARFIASSEYLGSQSRSRDFVGALDEWMRQRFSEVRYLVYLRRQQDWAVSKYSQYVRGGGTKPFDEFLTNQKLPDLDRIVSRWEGAVGADRLDVRLLDRDRLVGSDLLTDFCAAAGLDAERLKRCSPSNERLGARHAALLRRFNASVRSKVRWETPLWAIGRVANSALAFIPPGDARLALDPVSSDAIRAACAASNERLRARRFPHLDVLFR